jgi:hypothetical protein
MIDSALLTGLLFGTLVGFGLAVMLSRSLHRTPCHVEQRKD